VYATGKPVVKGNGIENWQILTDGFTSVMKAIGV
jgi:hypothetical protein